MSENKDKKVGKVILVAPWTNPLNYEESDTADFFDFEIDADFPNRTAGVTVFISSDDEQSVVKTVETLKARVKGIVCREYTDMGHFKDTEFSELLKECLE